MSTLLVICNGASDTHNVSDAINKKYGVNRTVIKNISGMHTDLDGNTYVIIEPYPNTALDKLLEKFKADPFNIEKFIAYMAPYDDIEFTIKLRI